MTFAFLSSLRCAPGALILVLASACAPATRAAFIPQLDIGLRSVRNHGVSWSTALRSAQRWDFTLFARFAWRSRRAVELIPTPRSLLPEAWDAVCADPQCDFRDPEESELAPWLGAEP